MSLNVLEMFRQTPVIDLSRLLKTNTVQGKTIRLVAKCDFLTPGFFFQDRLLLFVISKAKENGIFTDSMTLVYKANDADDDTVSSVALLASMFQCRSKIIVPTNSNKSIIAAAKAFGATIVESSSKLIKCSYFDVNSALDEYSSEYMEKVYVPELWNQLDAKLTQFIFNEEKILPGCKEYFSKISADVEISCSTISDTCNAKSEINVSKDEAEQMALILARKVGLLLGPKSGMNVAASIAKIDRMVEQGNVTHDLLICTSLPDVGLHFMDSIHSLELKSSSLRNIKPLHGNNDPEHEDTFYHCEIAQLPDLIGNTSLVDLSHLITNENGLSSVKLFAKMEFVTPGFSIKDRIVRHIFEKAEANGKLAEGTSVVAASSGNTGAATAMFGAYKDMPVLITTCDKCSEEKQSAIKAYGAELRISPPGIPESHAEHYMNVASGLAAKNSDWFDVSQYSNLDNPDAHCLTLGPEIYKQTYGMISTFICGGSTGGTISGVSAYLKQVNPEIRTMIADPVGSIFHQIMQNSKNVQGSKILVEGVGKGSIPECMKLDLIDEYITVSDQEAFKTCRILAKQGLLVGGSSGLNLYAALKVANTTTNRDEVVVTVFPDSGIKYLSKIYNDEWLIKENINL